MKKETAATETTVENQEEKDLVRITLDSGLELEIDRNFADDMELLDAMVEADEGNGVAISKICSRILGEEEKKKLYDSLRVNKRVKTTDVVPALMEIIEKVGKEGKN